MSAPAVGVHLDHQAIAELRVAQALADAVAGLGQLHDESPDAAGRGALIG